MCNICSELREFERQIRNIAAHEIVSVTDEWIKRNSGFNSEEIIDKLFSVLNSILNNRVNRINFFKSYNKMNDIIIKVLNIN